jgi:hypothetical protein
MWVVLLVLLVRQASMQVLGQGLCLSLPPAVLLLVVLVVFWPGLLQQAQEWQQRKHPSSSSSSSKVSRGLEVPLPSCPAATAAAAPAAGPGLRAVGQQTVMTKAAQEKVGVASAVGDSRQHLWLLLLRLLRLEDTLHQTALQAVQEAVCSLPRKPHPTARQPRCGPAG